MKNLRRNEDGTKFIESLEKFESERENERERERVREGELGLRTLEIEGEPSDSWYSKISGDLKMGS